MVVERPAAKSVPIGSFREVLVLVVQGLLYNRIPSGSATVTNAALQALRERLKRRGPELTVLIVYPNSVCWQYLYILIKYSPDMFDLTAFQRDLLYVIASKDEPHGLAIKEELEDYYEKEIHHGRLYPNLDTVVDKGLVEKGKADRRTNYYTLTARGRRELEARREWENQYVDELLSE